MQHTNPQKQKQIAKQGVNGAIIINIIPIITAVAVVNPKFKDDPTVLYNITYGSCLINNKKNFYTLLICNSPITKFALSLSTL
jgi:hypothetical protein